jgi:hypothetical protein
MKKALAGILLLAASSLPLFAAPADLTYVEGDAVLRLKAGGTQDAQIGDMMNTGDTLKTGADGLAELDQNGVTIKISSGTVFTLMEREASGKSTSVLSVALGSIKFRYDKLTGSEPGIRTNGAIAGVRGTELTVYSGADGTTFIAVDSGSVTVESQGQAVELGANEGVEVPLGKPPGQKITVHADQIDYKAWNDAKLAAMLADPAAAMANVEAAMAEYVANVTDYAARYEASKTLLDAERQKRTAILSEQGKDAAAKYEDEVVKPLALATGYLYLNVRYYSLAALSLRRYVAGRMYVMMKARTIADPSDPTWQSFLERESELLRSFEESIVPHLVAEDI